MAGTTVRPISPDEATEFLVAVRRGFGLATTTDGLGSDELEAFIATTDLDRTYAVMADGAVIGTGASRTFEVSVPGSTIPMGGLSMVTVAPEHQRRGNMSRILAAHFDDAIERGEPASILWSSEPSLYHRFGYGVASEHLSMRFDSRIVGRPDVGASGIELQPVAEDDALPAFSGVYESVLLDTPGMSTRSDDWWRFRVVRDSTPASPGWSERRLIAATREEVPVGYLIYRQKPVWDGMVNEGQIEVIELVASDPDAHLFLHRFASGISLFPHVSYPNAPIDDPYPLLVPDQRRIRRLVRDGLHMRPLDVPELLTQREYAISATFVIQIQDEFPGVTQGTYRLEVSPDGAECARTGEEPTVVMDVGSLGSVYLGGIRVSRLRRAGRIQGANEALHQLDAAMSWPRAPWSAEVF